jgi:hypothetical protein
MLCDSNILIYAADFKHIVGLAIINPFVPG